jgi:adenosylcobinamide-GDP ribazoletransferase
MRDALAFLTVIGRGRPPTHGTFDWFPVAGVCIGASVGAVWWGGAELWPLGVAAALAVVADLVLTGALHFDGLADTADGVLPHLPRDRRLAAMAAPDVGAFGIAAVAVAIVLRVVALSSMQPDVLLIAALWCTSRTTMAVAARSLPYARENGLASGFLDGAEPRSGRVGGVAAVGAALALALAATGEQGPGIVAVVACAVGAACVVALAFQRLGGFTGDVLGAAAVVGETVGLVVASARW